MCLTRESPPAVASLYLLLSQSPRLGSNRVPQTGRFLRGAAPTGPPHQSQILYAHMHAHTHTYTHGHTRSLAFLWKPRAGEPAAGPTICLPNFFQISPSSNLVKTELWRGFFFGGGAGGVGNKRLELNCNGQNPHEELSCQVGNKAWPASHAAGRCHSTGG